VTVSTLHPTFIPTPPPLISLTRNRGAMLLTVMWQPKRSYQCPPNSCRNPVIPAESSGIKFGRKACYFFSFQCLLFRRNLGIPELRPECSTEFAGMECNRIWLFACLFVCFTPVTKQTTNQTPCDMVSFCHPPPPPLLPPHQQRPQR